MTSRLIAATHAGRRVAETRRRGIVALVWALAVAVASAPLPLAGQDRPRLDIERADGSSTRVPVRLDRGYASVPVSTLEELGWSVVDDGSALSLSGAGEITVSMRVGSPFFRWDGVVLQLTDPPYRDGAQTYLPLQFLTDFLPRRLPGLYEFSPEGSVLRAGEISLIGTLAASGTAPAGDAAEPGRARGAAASDRAAADAAGGRPDRPDSAPATAEEVRNAGPSAYEGVRVVIIDPGHGGVDPGALGPDGVREKAVALGIGRRVAELLRDEPELEVHMIRDDDTFVDLWERGKIATEIKGERPGIFVSIHANSFPARRSARGFETYFLSDARTEHERRVSAIENAPLSMNPDNVDDDVLEDIDFILRDLKNYDHAHWSESLAALVQQELHEVHPGPDRGVKQGVLAVLTNALMPSVLVEVGYLSNEDEGRLLGTEDFHRDSAEAISEAVLRFFERYPPGNGIGSEREEP